MGTTARSKTVRTAVLIPTCNNGDTLPDVVAAACSTGLAVLVVDDGSSDGGCNSLAGPGLHILTMERNRGKGTAILAGAKWAEREGFTHIITVDADGQHDPLEVERFTELVQSRPTAIIVGMRDFSSDQVPGASKFGRKFSNFWVRVITGRSVDDSQSGFRAYPVEILNRLNFYGARYEFEVEVIVRGIWAGAEVLTVPVSARYTVETKLASRFRPFMDNLRISWIYTRLFFRNINPWPHQNLYGEPVSKQIRKYFSNPWTTLKSLLKERVSLSEIVSAAMLGIFLGTLPLFAVHSIVIIFVATRLHLNRLLALNVSHLCAPPLVPALALEAGHFIRHGRFLVEFNYQTLGYQFPQRLGDYLVGSVVLAPLLALAAGILVAGIILPFRYWRRRRRSNRENA